MNLPCRLIAGRDRSRSIIFEGAVSPEELPGYYRACDFFCSVPTGSESFGIVLLEAMSAGKAVVGSDIPGYSEIVSEGREGLLVDPRRVGEIARAMERLAADPGLRKRMAERGRETARLFDWSRIAARVEDIYRRVARGTEPRERHEIDRSECVANR
jgi:phosphatidylinositol alpha-mannosyltransferase